MLYYSDEYFQIIKQLAVNYLCKNYEFCYLDAMHKKNQTLGAQTIVVGSSHAMNGIIEQEFTNDIINFSVSSQDIYYDFMHIKKAVKESKTQIKNCIINLGYYMLYQDLSLSTNMNILIKYIYEPLFNDSHHYHDFPKYNPFENTLELGSAYISPEVLQRFCADWTQRALINQGTYYGIYQKRRSFIPQLQNETMWSTLSDDKKDHYAKARTNDHNKLIKHTTTKEENQNILRTMIKFLFDNSIKPIFVIFPFSYAYNTYINKQYRSDIIEFLNKVEYPVEYVDFNDYDFFTDNDFMDTDHLNYQGAQKASTVSAQ